MDRRGFRHFLLKEISESPLSVRKTLRGKLVPGEGDRLVVRLGDDVVPPALRQALSSGRIQLVLVVGQGTAAVAGQAVAAAIAKALPNVVVRAMPGTELSGWGLSGAGMPDDMSSVLVVAISQSGTTTDTNRTVDLVRARQAHVVAIVNRRNSDLVQKSHGVLYTSDGRDIEMSVASTKAFYSQVTAGHLLACGLAGGGGDDRRGVVRRDPGGVAGTALADGKGPGEKGGNCPDSFGSGPGAPFVGRGRQRSRPRRRRRGADQTFRAVLQGDRPRRCRGQKAHRPFGRAAGHRVRTERAWA